MTEMEYATPRTRGIGAASARAASVVRAGAMGGRAVGPCPSDRASSVTRPEALRMLGPQLDRVERLGTPKQRWVARQIRNLLTEPVASRTAPVASTAPAVRTIDPDRALALGDVARPR